MPLSRAPAWRNKKTLLGLVSIALLLLPVVWLLVAYFYGSPPTRIILNATLPSDSFFIAFLVSVAAVLLVVLMAARIALARK